MANPSTLFRFHLAISDVDRRFYGSLDLRLAMHPSESESYLLTRVIAYAVNFEDGLEFTAGLSSADEPAIQVLGAQGGIAKWIDIGNPTARRLHKASKAASSVRVYTYKDVETLKKECAGEVIHRVADILVYAVPAGFLKDLAKALKRDNHWTIIHNEGELMITVTGREGSSVASEHQTFMTTLELHRLG